MIPLSEIMKAKKKINGIVNKTPFAFAPLLTEKVGTNVYLKKENLQITGAYKIRGAYNKIASLSKDEKQRGVIAASAGNHAQGVAYSASRFNVPSTIIMPEATPLLKVVGTKALGAEVILKGSNYDEAYEYAVTYAKENSLTFIHPFKDKKIMAGQGTVALEMYDEIDDLDMILVPIGGGGLISGVASAIKQLDPRIKIVGVTAKGAPAMYESFKEKKPLSTKDVRTIADGIAVRDASKENLNIILECVDDIVQVDDEEIANAVLFLLERQKIVVEGAGAVGVAALMHKKIEVDFDDKVGVILSGGNIDVGMLSVIIEKGQIKAHRKMKLLITLIDKPGALRSLTDIFEELRANIIQIDYDRTSTTLSYGDANVTIALETKGKEHQETIRKALKAKGYRFHEEF
ncbi:MAG: threonine ammonia-lyase [Epsilonproteobacteria bacterium]|nr:threonine ammonia-lyase [Campylobacterota bacterium]